MEKLITEVHDIVFPDVDPTQWANNLDVYNMLMPQKNKIIRK